MPVGIGIVGCGGAAVDLCRAIDALLEARLVAAYDQIERAADELAAPRRATVHRDLEALLADPAVEVVYIALPHDLLAPTAELALRAGRHVLVEKPMALDVASIHGLAELGREVGRAVGVMFELREVAAIREARRLVRGGAIGRVVNVRIRTVIDKPMSYWRSGPNGRGVDGWRAQRARAGGGVVLMNTVHQLDLVRHVTGQGFVRAAAEIANLVSKVEVEDAAAAVLRLSDGGIASLTASAHSPGAEHEERIDIDGTEGRLDLPDPYGDGPLRLFVRRRWHRFAANRWTDINPPQRDAHAELLRGFLRAIRRGAPVPVGAPDAAAALIAALAIYRSAASGRAEPIDPDSAAVPRTHR
jgi:predicted dehydrogenase